MTRQEIVDQAKGYKGVRALHQGRTMKGIDCWGLIMCVATDFNLTPNLVKEFMNYPINPTSEMILSQAGKTGLEKIDRGNAGAGDIIILSSDRQARHIAILTGTGTMIHVNRKVGRKGECIESKPPPGWQIVRAYRFPGLEC